MWLEITVRSRKHSRQLYEKAKALKCSSSLKLDNVIFGAFTMPIVVVDYDSQWPLIYERLRSGIWPAIADVAESIEHVGSTSVPGLPAKPIIDATIIVADSDRLRLIIQRLDTIGYRHRGETELAEELPLHVVTRWMGNSKPVAVEHYLQVSDAHFAKAVNGFGKAACQTARKEGKTGENGEKYICGDVAEYAGKQGENGGFALAGDARDRNRTCTPFGTGT